jgi:hypothetical protein
LSLIPQHRTWKIGLRGFHKDAGVPGGTWDCATNTWWVTVQANTDEQIEVQISGEKRIHDNSDVPARCEDLLCTCQMPYEDKSRLLSFVLDAGYKKPPILRVRVMHVSGSASPAAGPLVELLTLTDRPEPRQ